MIKAGKRGGPVELFLDMQGVHHRLIELFARMLSENHELRLFYNNGGEAYTDGETIVVDPSIWELFADKEKLRKIGDYLNWPESILADKENALMIDMLLDNKKDFDALAAQRE